MRSALMVLLAAVLLFVGCADVFQPAVRPETNQIVFQAVIDQQPWEIFSAAYPEHKISSFEIIARQNEMKRTYNGAVDGDDIAAQLDLTPGNWQIQAALFVGEEPVFTSNKQITVDRTGDGIVQLQMTWATGDLILNVNTASVGNVDGAYVTLLSKNPLIPDAVAPVQFDAARPTRGTVAFRDVAVGQWDIKLTVQKGSGSAMSFFGLSNALQMAGMSSISGDIIVPIFPEHGFLDVRIGTDQSWGYYPPAAPDITAVRQVSKETVRVEWTHAAEQDFPYAMNFVVFRKMSVEDDPQYQMVPLVESRTEEWFLDSGELIEFGANHGYTYSYWVQAYYVSQGRTYASHLSQAAEIALRSDLPETTATLDELLVTDVWSTSILLDPEFDPDVLQYSATVDYDVSTVLITPVASAPDAVLTVNGVEAPSGELNSVELNPPGSITPIRIVVLAAGTEREYRVDLERPLSSDADLAALTVDGLDLVPQFDPDILEYSATVAHAVETVMITATLSDPSAVLTVDGFLEASGQPTSLSLEPPGDTTVIHILVQAADGAEKEYRIEIERLFEADTDLADLTITDHHLVPEFDADTVSYTVAVEHDVDSIALTAVLSDLEAVLTINGEPAISGDPVSIALSSPGNTTPITVVVQGVDESEKTYTVDVERGFIASAVPRSSYMVDEVGFHLRLATASTFPAGQDNSLLAEVEDDFWIGETVVTYALWYPVRLWAEDNGYIFRGLGREGSVAPSPGSEPSEDRFRPVTDMSWYDAAIWCNALSEMQGYTAVYTDGDGAVLRDATELTLGTVVVQETNGFRLPSLNEWELAARYIGPEQPVDEPLASEAVLVGGSYWTPGTYASGAVASVADDEATYAVAWGADNSGGIARRVAQKRANQLGLYDMSGNVLEWCDAPLFATERPLKGGSFWSSSPDLQVFRAWMDLPDGGTHDYGFRLVRADLP